MSRSKREKQEAKTMRRWIILFVICLIIVIGTFIVIHDLREKVEEVQTENTVNFVEIVNETENEVEDEENIIENTENTEATENVNTTKTTTTNKKSVENTNQASYTPAATDNKQKAVDLVKENWGDDNSVGFAFEYINENGEYIVSVRDKSSATVKNYFRVDLETETVELD